MDTAGNLTASRSTEFHQDDDSPAVVIVILVLAPVAVITVAILVFYMKARCASHKTRQMRREGGVSDRADPPPYTISNPLSEELLVELSPNFDSNYSNLINSTDNNNNSSSVVQSGNTSWGIFSFPLNNQTRIQLPSYTESASDAGHSPPPYDTTGTTTETHL